MAAVEVTLSGVWYDKVNRTMSPGVFIGEASLTGLGVGGGPIIPPPRPPDSGLVPGWPEIPPYPGQLPPGTVPPHIWGPTDPRPTPPIYIPPMVPPSLQPPEPPAPGSPTTPVPPPAGSAGWPVQPITPPAYIVVQYPGVGPVWVAAPLTATPK